MKSIYGIGIFALCFTLFAAEHVKVSPEEVLFLAHFNTKAGVETGNVDELINNAEVTSGNGGFPFKDSAPANEALNIVGRERYFSIGADGNFNPARGTLQFMVKPQWGTKGYNHCVIFHLVFDKEKRGSYAWNGVNSFYIQKPPHQEHLGFTQDGNHAANTVKKQIPHSRDRWYQLTVTWDAAAGQRSFYIDGALIGIKKFRPFSAQPVELCFGGLKTWNGQSLIDEVRILDRVLTPEEVRQDYDALMEGREFPAPPKPGTEDVSFSPVKPEKQPESANFTGEVFQCPYLDANIALDGTLRSPVWKHAYAVGNFLFANGKIPEAKTEVKMFHNAEALYLGAVMNEPAMQHLVAKFDQNDLNIWSDDCFEMVLDTAGRSDTFYHFVINALGSCYDARGGSRTWNARGMQIKTSRLKDRWIVEMKIPFAAFGVATPQVGEFWGIRFCRERFASKTEYTSSPVVKNGPFSQRNYFAKLYFVPGSSEYDLAVQPERQTFQMGVNHLKLDVKNPKKINGKVRLKTSLYDKDGKCLAVQEIETGVADRISLAAKVADDRAERMAVTVLIDGKTVCGTVLRRGFDSTGKGLQTLAAELDDMNAYLGELGKIRHPVHRGVVSSIERMKNALAEYRGKLDFALESGTTVSEAETVEIAALANGFRRFQDKYRYLIWETSPWEFGSPEALPPVNYKHNLKLDYRVAGNEREVKTFILSGLLCGKRLDLRVMPRSYDTSGKFISTDQFEVYQEPFVNHNGDLITAPLVRAPGNIVTLTPGTNARVWVIFNSRGVAPGNYAMEIEIKPQYDYSIPNRNIPVALKVWNFTLPETHEWPIDMFFWGPQLSGIDETAMLRLMHNYHVKWTMTESHSYLNGFIRDRRWFGKAPAGKKYDENLVKHANQEFFEEAKRLKMKIVFAWGTGPDANWHKLMADRLLKMGFTYQDFIFHGLLRDEFSKKDIPPAEAARRETKKLLPEAQFMATYLSTPPPSGATLEDIEQTGLSDFFKVWAVISGRLEGKQGPETREFFRKRGNILWAYRCQTQMQLQSILSYYRFFPWTGYLEGLDGVAFWCSYSAKGDDGFDHRDGYDDGITWRGIDKKPVPTKRFEAVREGLEDVAYMDLLKKRIAAAKNKGIDCSGYEKLLTVMPKEIMRDESQKKLDLWRLEVGEAIDKLSRRMK